MAPTYAEQLEDDAAQLRAATGMTHGQYVKALQTVIADELKACEFLLADYQLPIPHPKEKP